MLPTEDPNPYLLDQLQSVNWEVIKNGDSYELERVLEKFVMAEPFEPINGTCKPEPLSKPVCTDYPEVFSGPLNQTAKIAHIIQFGVELDVLEILLNEMDEFVDRFFLLESTISHSDFKKKPLYYEAVKL